MASKHFIENVNIIKHLHFIPRFYSLNMKHTVTFSGVFYCDDSHFLKVYWHY